MRRFVPTVSRALSRPLFNPVRPFASVPSLSGIKPDDNEEFKTHDGLFEMAQRGNDAVDPTKRAHTYFMLGTTKMMYACAGRLALVKVIGSLSASADVLALSSIEVDLAALDPGSAMTVKWRGNPVFVKHRTEAEIQKCVADDGVDLRDPQSDAERYTTHPNFIVVMGVCTHLGCVPIHGAGDFGGWFCPCHGSHYDGAGRIRKGPAPLNLEIPEYKINGNTLVLG
jgi:ubiquinol-cytochrome c reductase iron-sulfur subunit